MRAGIDNFTLHHDAQIESSQRTERGNLFILGKRLD